MIESEWSEFINDNKCMKIKTELQVNCRNENDYMNEIKYNWKCRNENECRNGNECRASGMQMNVVFLAGSEGMNQNI